MGIEYLAQSQYMSSIEIEDVHNCNLIAYNDTGFAFLFNANTVLGYTNLTLVKNIPPDNAPDWMLLNNILSIEISKQELTSEKLESFISRFINNPKFAITQVMEIDDTEYEENYIHALALLKE